MDALNPAQARAFATALDDGPRRMQYAIIIADFAGVHGAK